ncbi:hypothetical protein FRC08_014327 [Ceratobasidium sp. 394]|nr:hypothetical protein FRC08_014327 [Ceratobasidium sp. 394]
MHTLSLNCSISDISDNFLGADSANHVPEVIDLSDRDDALVPPPTAYILGRLQQEGDLPVLLALARFLQADDSTHSSDLALDCVPTNVSHKVPLQDINQLYELWLSTPCPPSPRLTEVEQQLRSIPKSEHDDDIVQPSFSAFAPFTKDVKSEIVHPPIDTMSSLLAPSSPSLIDIDSSSDSEHLDAASDMEVHLSNPSSAPLTSSPPAPLIQSTLPFKQVSCKEWREQERRRWEESHVRKNVEYKFKLKV